jgi:hypothetical protein
MESRKPKNIHAIQLVIGALAGMMLARRPDEVDEMIAGIRTALPKAYRTSGPGGAILSQLEEARKTIRGKGLRPSKPRGKR